MACTPGSRGCAQLHQIKADACLSLGSRAAPVQQATDYDCAITEYQVAIAAQLKQKDPMVDTARLIQPNSTRCRGGAIARDPMGRPRGSMARTCRTTPQR